MYKNSWYNFLKEIERKQIFALCKEFDELSLEDKGSSSSSKGSSSSSSSSIMRLKDKGSSSSSKGSSSSSISPIPTSYDYGSSINSFLSSKTPSLWSRNLIAKVRAPLIDIPRNLTESFRSYNICMGFGFRFLPGQSQFLTQELMLPESFDRLSILSDSLGLSYYRRPISLQSIFPYCHSGAGLRGLATGGFNKLLVEVMTYYQGNYWRILVLVYLGIGSTVWYTVAPGSPFQAPDSSLFCPFESYEKFFENDHNEPGFSRVGFVELRDVSPSVESAFDNELPLSDIIIPASGLVLTSVALGVMIAFFLTVGLIPNEPINENV